MQETHLVFETYRDGKLQERLEERGFVGIISREKLHQLLTQAGFEVRQEFSDCDFAEFQEGSSLLIVEAEKKDVVNATAAALARASRTMLKIGSQSGHGWLHGSGGCLEKRGF